MPATSDEGGSRRFCWRDALAFAIAFPRITLRRKPHLGMSALARISAMDIHQTPRQRFFDASDGGLIAYRSYECDNALHVVLVHGSACFGDQFHLLARKLSEQGVATVHTLDMRGHGQSSGEVDGFTRYAEDVLEFVATLKQADPRRQVVIGGHSAGGGLVINIARNFPAEAVAGWMLFAPLVAITDSSVKPYFGGWVARFRRVQFMLVVAANMLGIRRLNDRPLLHFDRDVCLHDPRYMREWSFNAVFGFGPGYAYTEKPVISGVPLLLAAGDQDECFAASQYPAALARLAPEGECRIFEGLGHWDILVDERAMETYGNWLGRHFHGEAAENRGTEEIRHANFG